MFFKEKNTKKHYKMMPHMVMYPTLLLFFRIEHRVINRLYIKISNRDKHICKLVSLL